MLRRSHLAIAACAVLTLVASGCGGPKGEPSASAAAANAGVGNVFNPSDARGGTLKFAHTGDFDSLDPGNTYYGYSWDFIRLYGRSLVMFAPQPGAAGTKLAPDLAESLGVPSDDAKTWTYRLRRGLKFEDGTPITAKDVKYAVERSLDRRTFPNGPTYFTNILDTRGYKGPYDDPTPDKLGLTAVETPDDLTVVFRLKHSFATFDYLAMQPTTIPVPQAKDTGTRYTEHPISSGPYKFATNERGKSFTLVRNDQWDPSSDPNRKALPDRIEVALNVNADDIDNRLISGDLHVAMEGTGVGAAAQGRILADPNLKKNTDSATLARLWYISVNPNVAPLDNIHCRKAVLYAADHEGFQRAFGGPTGGDIATTLMPPQVPGAPKTDPYGFKATPNGDLDRARKELAECGQSNGFETNISYRTERPKEKATAESMQQALAKVGIKLTIKPYAQGDYFKLYAGNPDFAKANKLGLMLNGWSADWNDGFGFLQQIVDSRVIRPTGGSSNLSVAIPDVDGLLDKALVTTDTAAREEIWGQIDKRVLDEAVVLPGVWARVLLYRPPTLTNVFVNEGLGSYYDYTALGVGK